MNPPGDSPAPTPAADLTAPAVALRQPSEVVAPSQANVAPATQQPGWLWWIWILALVAFAALITSGMLWQRLSGIQEQLAKQSAESGVLAIEAHSLAKEASELSRDMAAKLALAEAKFTEGALQRSQLEELMQSLSRSRDENLVVDIESAVRLAQQQAQLTGSLEPLLAALKTADLRLVRAAQPRLAPLQRAIGRDLGRIKTTALSDTLALLVKLDDLVRLADELPLANAVASVATMGDTHAPASDLVPNWWTRTVRVVFDEARSLLRVSRVEQPEAALLSPEQSFFVRENLKLKLLNARLGLLARQLESSRADVRAASTVLNRYFDATARKTQAAATLLQQVQADMRTLELPRVDDTLAALTTAAAGR
jgi:uroporphyrin-III C-methyltransferase